MADTSIRLKKPWHDCYRAVDSQGQTGDLLLSPMRDGAFAAPQRTLQSYEAIHMRRKGQLEGIAKGDVLAQNRVIN